jgi:hypothetical protein
MRNLFGGARRRAIAPMTPPPEATDARISVDQFSYFAGYVVFRGRIEHPRRTLRTVSFHASDKALAQVAASAPDPAGASQGSTPFSFMLDTALNAFEFRDPQVRAIFDDGAQARFETPGIQEILSDRGHRLFPEFADRIQSMPIGAILEIGSRARSGVTRRDLAPAGWEYVGLDIVEGPNVDVVGDAHELSRFLPHRKFDAAMSLSVFEHLAMPWKVVLELNRVLKPGGLVFVQTHQTFPLHDEPWDFWRISADAWPALFNPKTGFCILDSGMAEPLMFVARRWHPGVNLHESRGCAVSSVIAEKIGESSLSWDVELRDVLGSNYPA